MVKHFATGTRILIWLTLLVLLYAIIWLQGGTRELPWARGWVTHALNPDGAPYAISIGDVSIRWQDIRTFGDLRVTNMQLSRKDGGIFATIPEVSISLDALGFWPTHNALHGITIDRPRLFVVRDVSGVLRLGIEGMLETLPVNDLTAFFGSDDKQAEDTRQRMPFSELRLQHAALNFTDESTGDVLKSDDFSFDIDRDGGNLRGGIALPFTYRDQPGSLNATLFTQAVTRQRLLNARLLNVPADLVCMFAACPADFSFAGPISGTVTLKKKPRQPIGAADIALSTEKAVLTAPAIFPEPLPIKSAQVTLRAGNQLNDLAFDHIAVDLPDTKLVFKGLARHQQDGWYAQGEGTATHLDMDKLYKYWPLTMAADSRKYVVTHITTGYADNATLKFNFRPEDMSGRIQHDEALYGTASAHGLKVDYLEGFPPVTAANGSVIFTGKTIKAHVDSGKLLTGTTLKPSLIEFTDLTIPAAPMKTDINLSAPARDVVTILKLKPFTFDDGVNLDPARITGSAEAELKLGFDAFSGDTPSNAATIDLGKVDYDIVGSVADVAQPQMIGTRDISGLSGTFKANRGGAAFDGNVKLEGGTDMAISLKDGPNEHDTTLTAKGTIARNKFVAFGLPDLSQVGDGSVGIDAALDLAKDASALKRAAIDLTHVPVTIDEISWSKPVGAAASLTVTPGSAHSYGLALDAPGLAVGNATITLNAAGDEVATADLPHVRTETSDFALNYATKPDGYAITIKGNALDLSKLYAGEPTPVSPAPKTPPVKKKPGLLENFPALDLTVDLANLILVKEHPLTDVKGILRCDKARCGTANFTAKTGASNLKATIGPVNGARELQLTDSNAGDFLRALDISDRVYGGTFDIHGTYDDTKSPAPLTGRVLIQSFKLKNSEILARIISIGSLSGFLNVLTGAGIDFDKFGTDIGARAGVINVTQGRAHSNAIGLTLEGSVDTNQSVVNLRGVVVPANSLNSIFGKLPIIGALAGGEGEGLIAFNYSVKGPMGDPNVFVNPLSGLTPGFLRGIFTAGEKKVEKIPAMPSDSPTPAPAEAPPAEHVPWPGEKEEP